MKLDFEEEHGFIYVRGGDPPRPLIPVTLAGRRGRSVNTYALLDSGADETMFHSLWAGRIGLDYKSGKHGIIGGIKSGQPVEGFYHFVQLRVGSTFMRCEVFFSDGIGDAWDDQLIGRSVVFERMRFAFRGQIDMTYLGKER